MGLSTFAFLHPLDAAEVGRFQRALPEVEFLVPAGRGLPQGLERAQA